MSCPVYLPGDENLVVCREFFGGGRSFALPIQFRCQGCADIIMEIGVDGELLARGPEAIEAMVKRAMRDHVRRDEERMGL